MTKGKKWDKGDGDEGIRGSEGITKGFLSRHAAGSQEAYSLTTLSSPRGREIDPIEPPLYMILALILMYSTSIY